MVAAVTSYGASARAKITQFCTHLSASAATVAGAAKERFDQRFPRAGDLLQRGTTQAQEFTRWSWEHVTDTYEKLPKKPIHNIAVGAIGAGMFTYALPIQGAFTSFVLSSISFSLGVVCGVQLLLQEQAARVAPEKKAE